MATVCYPAIPAVPGRDAVINTDANLGWNAGAVSVRAQPGDARAEFVFGVGNVGSLAGIAPPGSISGEFNAITHGVLYTGDTLQIVESGVMVEDSAIEPSVGTIVTISRVGSVVSYSVGSWSYTSATASYGDVQLAAALYAAGDYVDNPALAGLVSVSAESTWGWEDEISVNALRAASAWGWTASATLGDGYALLSFDMEMLASEEAVGFCLVSAGDVELSAQAGFVVVDAAGLTTSIPLDFAATGIAVIGGGIDDSMELLALGAEDDFGFASGEVADLSAFGVDPGESEHAGSYAEGLYLANGYVSPAVIYALLSESLEASDLLEFIVAIDGELADTLVLDGTATAYMVLEAILQSGMVFGDNVSTVRSELLQYATNIVTGAVGSYANFGFNGFARVGMTTYGWKPDGLYRIGADTDDGDLISATVDFAANDFGTSVDKGLDAMFFGLDTDGQVFAKVLSDRGKEAVYRVVQSKPNARGSFAKGVRSRYWRIQLQIVDATFADLDNIEWVVGASTRRTRR